VEKRTGTLQIIGRESRLNSVLLARCDAQDDPIQEATGFLQDIPLQSGDSIWVTGSDGNVGGTHVFCIAEAGKNVALGIVARTLAAEKAAPKPVKKTAKVGTKRGSKTPAKKKAKTKAKQKVKSASKGQRKKP
jgi:hypothetical protein